MATNKKTEYSKYLNQPNNNQCNKNNEGNTEEQKQNTTQLRRSGQCYI